MKNPTAYMITLVLAMIAVAVIFGIISGPLAGILAPCALFILVAAVTVVVQK